MTLFINLYFYAYNGSASCMLDWEGFPIKDINTCNFYFNYVFDINQHIV